MRGSDVLLSFEYYAAVDCDVSMQQITLAVRLYRHDAVTGQRALVGTGANTTTNAYHGEAETSPALCVPPGEYSGETDYTVVFPNGSTSSGTWTYNPRLVVCTGP